MTLYHIPTVYLIVGLLYLLLPWVIWMVLARLESHTARLWCLGGASMAVGLLLVGLRAQISPWLSYPLANTLAWSDVLMQALALRRALNQTWQFTHMIGLLMVWLGVFEYFRVIAPDPSLRFSWAMIFFFAVFAYIAHLAWRIHRRHGLASGRWLSVVYGLASCMMLWRVLRVLLGQAEPEATSQGIDSALTICSGLLISVIGSFAFVSMFLERSAKREIEAVQQRVRQEENARLGTQIAHLDRQRALGAMSTSFAHELSQPLTAILMDAQTLKVGLQAGDMATHEVLTLIDSVEGHTTRTVQLVERIRDFIRPTKSFYALVDLKQLLRDVADLLAHDIRVQKVQITYDLEAVDCVVQGDRVQLSQILLNVYRNAMQAMLNQDKKHILVTMEQQERQVVLRIQDNGNGVIDAIKDKVGQAFVTTKEGGLGVGLSISRTIAELHGGSLTIANAVGSGALVELNLPRAA